MGEHSNDRIALVTGGARGIGEAITRRLVHTGHPVVINYATSAGPAEALAAEINAAGGRAISIGADVADSNSVTAMFEQATEELGPPTIVVNNAGVSEPASALKMEPASWDRMIAVNLSGAFYCTHAALPAMYERGWGRVVFLGSPGGGRTISAGMTAYAAAKAGIVAMTRALAVEVARRGITVNTVTPGYVLTDMTRSSGDAVVARMDETWPHVPPEGVADIVAFIVSDEARFVSGEDVAAWLGGPSTIVARPQQA